MTTKAIEAAYIRAMLILFYLPDHTNMCLLCEQLRTWRTLQQSARSAFQTLAALDQLSGEVLPRSLTRHKLATALRDIRRYREASAVMGRYLAFVNARRLSRKARRKMAAIDQRFPL
jgi:hypothetical protein